MRIFIGLCLVCFVLLGPGMSTSIAANSEGQILEEKGLELNPNLAMTGFQKSDIPVVLLDSLPSRDVLLIPNSASGERGINIFDPFDGAYIGNFVLDETLFYTPLNAIPGPDGNIYVSDQVNDAVFVFDRQGTYLETYADASDGLDNVRGIDFREGHLFISISPSTGKAILEFDGPHSRLPDFINDGSDPFDIFFLEDGRALLSDIAGSTDNVRLYNADGTLVGQIFSVSFPEQIQSDSVGACPFLNTSFTTGTINDFDLSGIIEQTTPWPSGRGIYRLGNGNLLATSGNGVFEIEPGTGAIIEQKFTGSGRYIELIPFENVIPPCDYIIGDVNNNGAFNGIDVTYGVSYFKGGSVPPYSCDCDGSIWFVAGDVNGNCAFNGIDITYMVTYFKGGAAPVPCPECPPPVRNR